MKTSTSTPEEHYDLVVIGAGPHALALVARLLEHAPASLISENEHSRLAKLHSKGQKGFTSPFLDIETAKKRILVIDSYGKWMGRWDRNFEAYDIQYLRSPLFFHMDPSDPNALKSFAHRNNKSHELHDITKIVDTKAKRSRKNASLIRNFNPADRDLFYTPSKTLFSEFCDDLVDRYQLHDIVVKGVCENIDKIKDVFHVSYSTSTSTETVFAKAVVSAIGNTNLKNIPEFVKNIKTVYPENRIAHAYDFIECLRSEHDEFVSDHKEIIPKGLELKLKSDQMSTLLVVGGGLTSAQLVDIGIKRGFKRVVLLMRSVLKIRQFDFSLDLVGRNSGPWLARFWMESCPKRRLAMIRKERNGGSITPEYLTILRKYEEQDILNIHEKASITSAEWKGNEDGYWSVKADNIEIQCDQIWLATGGIFDIRQEPVFKTIAERYPIETVNGLPVLNADLQLHPDLDFYVMSGYSSVMLGPTAANILGGRVAAERIASKLWDKWSAGAVDCKNTMKHRSGWTMSDVAANMCNYFSALVDTEA
jgi:hypothetical protein